MMQGRRWTWAAIALIVLIPMLLLGDALLPGQVLADAGLEQNLPWLPWAPTSTEEELALPQVNYDTFRENLVYRVFLHETLGKGEIPWWNPYAFGGYPFLALSHTEVLYPPNWVAAQFDPYFAYGAFIAFHLALAGLGMFFLLRTMGLSAGPVLFGAVVFMLNGMFATRHGHPQFVVTACWLPWALLGVQWLTGGRRAAGALLVATCTALVILAGHPSIYVFGYYLVGAWLLARLFVTCRGDPRSLRAWIVLLFVLAFAIGVGLASTQLLATFEMSHFSSRAVRPFSGLVARLSHWSHLLRLVFPFITGTRVDGSYWSITFTHEWAGTLYLGIAPLILALFGALRSGWRGRFLGGVVLVCMAIMFVPAAYWVVYHAFPGFKFSRPDRVSVVYFIAMSALSAFGLEALLKSAAEEPVRRVKALLATALPWLAVLAVLVAVALWTIPGLEDRRHLVKVQIPGTSHLYDQILRGSVFWLAAVGWLVAARAGLRRRWLLVAIFAVAGLDLGLHARHYVVVRDADRYFRETPAITFLKEVEEPFRIAKLGGWHGPGENRIFPANTPTVYGIEDIHGFGPMHIRVWEGLMEAIDPGRHRNPWHLEPIEDRRALESPVFDMLQVRYVLAERPLSYTSLELVHEGDLYIYENTDVLPRAWFVGDWQVLPVLKEVVRQLAEGEVDPRSKVLLAATPSILKATDRGGIGEVEVLSRDLRSIRLRKTGDAGIIVLSQAWYPGWRVTGGGNPRRALRANAA
ncbi:MAG: YfhO family protein, partial [Deltaproteobacteria bacterium]|nr:YfhO family protein [Deltaproteobacteria bacterium]